MNFSELFTQLKKTLLTHFSKQNLTKINIVCYSLIFLSTLIALLGFGSLVFAFYIGDDLVRLFLILMALFLGYLIYYSFIQLQKKRNLLYPIILTSVVLFCAYFLPLLPPEYGLRQFDVDASLLKFIIISIVFLILGLLSASFAFKPLYKFTSRSNQYAAYYIIIFSILIILYPLGIIIGNIIANGAGGITWEFLTQDVIAHGAKGGIFPALIGTILIIIGTGFIAIPLGVATAIFLVEYARSGYFVRIIRVAADILQGVPSIVHGLFGLAFFVPLFGISVLSGVCIMGFLTLPVIIRASEEALMAVPQNLREGSYALGASKWQTIRRVVLPPSIPGILTGTVLGLGRAAGETAPIMFTAVAFLGAGIPKSPFAPIQALSNHLLILTRYMGAYPVEQNAWATAFILIGIVLGMNAVAIVIREKYRVEF